MNKARKSNSGFTLIELLVVIAIIGLLASIALYALSLSRAKARNVRRLADVQEVAKGLELYFNVCGSYPVGSMNLGTTNQQLYTGSAASCGNNSGTSGNGGIGTAPTGDVLVGKVPAPPTPGDGVCAFQNTYNYTGRTSAGGMAFTSPAPSYTLYFCIGDTTGSYSGGGLMQSPTGIVSVPLGD